MNQKSWLGAVSTFFISRFRISLANAIGGTGAHPKQERHRQLNVLGTL
jgi:hypothetical protein